MSDKNIDLLGLGLSADLMLFSSKALPDFGFVSLAFKISPAKAKIDINIPTRYIIIIIPNCQLFSGSLCRTFGYGIVIGGWRTSFLNLFNTPVSLSHMVAF